MDPLMQQAVCEDLTEMKVSANALLSKIIELDKKNIIPKHPKQNLKEAFLGVAKGVTFLKLVHNEIADSEGDDNE